MMMIRWCIYDTNQLSALPEGHTVSPKAAASPAQAAQFPDGAPPTSAPLSPGPFSLLPLPEGLSQKANQRNQ